MVVEEGGETHTINLCQQCHNRSVSAAATESVAMDRSRGEESASWQDLERDGEMNNLNVECGSTSLSKGQK